MSTSFAPKILATNRSAAASHGFTDVTDIHKSAKVNRDGHVQAYAHINAVFVHIVEKSFYNTEQNSPLSFLTAPTSLLRYPLAP